VPTTSSLAFVNPWFNPINPAAYHPVTRGPLNFAVSNEGLEMTCGTAAKSMTTQKISEWEDDDDEDGGVPLP